MEIPAWLKNHLNAEGVRRIEDTVARVETKTSGEIVPMVVSRSSSAHSAFVVSVLVMSLVAFVGTHYFYPQALTEWWIALVMAVIIVAISYGMARCVWVQRLLLPDIDLIHQANMRAELEFWKAGLHKTDGSTGILLFVSLAEHWAVVLADDSISKKVPDETWEHVVDKMIQGIREKDLAQGFCNAVEACETILSEKFPAGARNRNELANKLIIKDGFA